MKLTLKDKVIALSADTPEEAALCAKLAAQDGHVFRLHANSERGFSLAGLGPEPDACREPLNITRSTPAPFAEISNLAETPFELDGETYASVEGFWQGLKFDDPALRRKLATLSGAEAKHAGDAAGSPETIGYAGRAIRVGTPDHWDLMRMACRAKFLGNDDARAALAATGQRHLTHRVRNDSRTIPGVIMADIWMRIRDEL